MTLNSPPVIISHGKRRPFDQGKLRKYLESLAFGLDLRFISINEVLDKVNRGLPPELTVSELIDFVAETCASMTIYHYDYSNLAARVLEKLLQDTISTRFSENIELLRRYMPNNGRKNYKHLISEQLFKIVMNHQDEIDLEIVPERDFNIDYFGFRTLQKSYLLKIENKCHETPQFLLMRVALALHGENLKKAFETYRLMSERYLLHASPTLFNAGTEFQNLSSCFLVALEDDSLDGIFDTVHECAMISKASGGIGVHISNVRSSGTYISGTNGVSSGIVPMLRVFNSVSQYVDQGGNKRPGAICAYLEPWHSDVMEFLDMRKNYGKEEMRARDLFYALWIPDLFMRRVKNDEIWSLFSEDTSPGLSDKWGSEFDQLYIRYESEKRFIRQVKARKVWEKILISQSETGTPFLLYKDACNAKSNQKNLGTIKSSNLCSEIVEYSSKDETAVCNLGSLGLPMYVEIDSDDQKVFNLQRLHSVTKVLVRNLNRVIDVGDYPLKKCRVSNLRHRPIAVGVQGLADAFLKMKLSFGCKESRRLNRQIFQTIYHGALEASMELSKEEGPYQSYSGSPVSQGILQYDMWDDKPVETDDIWDWTALKNQISCYGVRNSLLVALMPTASTSQILGFSECFEPITSNVYTRRVLSGEHQVVNRYLIDDLIGLGLWNPEMKNEIIAANGSIQDIPSIPDSLRNMYRTIWEISQRVVIDMAADRAPYIDQSQSMNLFLENCSMSKMTSMHFYAWEKGLKTGIYYLRTQAASQAIKFTITPEMDRSAKHRRAAAAAAGLVCDSRDPSCDCCSG
ncbi:hypothetical protein FOA43_002267 [Brettanomyces nanus]|uniref:Ribonucleoside-diphosphate reductase n=1 Tax=Eeniella nana TaxID=13502 RepID=A0A875S588_EENNA|nr:uncharacterized protein FOA43_002267 [Brettanomyces nanus]QPG74929.1 hypothetical protein FOA43_002267 [Brettanomyces nanus]